MKTKKTRDKPMRFHPNKTVKNLFLKFENKVYQTTKIEFASYKPYVRFSACHIRHLFEKFGSPKKGFCLNTAERRLFS